MRFNRIVLRVLNGPFHRALPRGLAEISYTAPVTGRSIRLPAQCVADGSRFLVVAGRPERKLWWRTFRHPHPAQLVCGGSRYDAVGHVLTDPDRTPALETYLVTHPGSRRGISPTTPVIAFEAVSEADSARLSTP